MSNQPSWHCVANYGDATPEEYGGQFLMIDRRGVYDPELWVYSEDEPNRFHCIILEQCHKIGYTEIGDNRFHPNKVAWFGSHEKLSSVSETMDIPLWKLIDQLCGNPYERAHAYHALAMYYGMCNFDHDPWIVGKKKALKIIRICKRQIAQASNWPDGFPA